VPTEYTNSDVIVESLSTLAGYLFLIAVILFFINYRWLEKYALFLGTIIYLPLKVAAVLLFVISKSVGKSIAAVLVMGVVTVMFVFSELATLIGGVAIRADARLENRFDSSPVVREAEAIRDMLVQTQLEIDDEPPEFDSEEEYREKLEEVPKKAKNRLETGEWMLSVVIGGMLLIMQRENVQVVQDTVLGLSLGSMVQWGLFLVALSITYRVAILDLLAFERDEDFSSLQEMDIAFSYQKMVSLSGLPSLLTFFMVIAKYFSNLSLDTVHSAVRDDHVKGKSVLETMRAALSNIQNNEEEAEDVEKELEEES